MMSSTPFKQPTGAPAPLAAPVLDAERLDVFHVAVEFHRLVPDLTGRAGRSLRDQLERASASIALNLCEGVARRAPLEKAHFVAISRGSAAESAAVVHLLRARGLVEERVASRARALLVRTIGMLTRLEQSYRRP
jgi:four helix bundle protein